MAENVMLFDNMARYYISTKAEQHSHNNFPRKFKIKDLKDLLY